MPIRPTRGIRRHVGNKFLWILIGTAVLFLLTCSPLVLSQLSPADSEGAAGDQVSFDVVSIKQNTSGRGAGINVSAGDGTQPFNGSLFTATDVPVSALISFSYKLNIVQSRTIGPQLPRWANEERFDIQAHVPTGTTKDQVRLMTQSLLADRFHLKAHVESRKTSVYALELIRAGNTGPKLQLHSAEPPCPDASAPASGTQSIPAGLPTICGAVIAGVMSGVVTYAGRDVSMRMIAENLPMTPNNGLDRPVVDKTGLVGAFDFVLKYAPQPSDGANPQSADFQDAFLEALKDQLGLKLKPATALLDALVIDHIDQPSPN